VLEAELVGFLVALRAGRLDGWSFGGIQKTKLNSGDIGVDGHLAAKRIDLAHDLALGLAADGRIAAHLGDRIEIAGQEQGRDAHSRCCQRRFRAGMPGSANDHIEWYRIVYHYINNSMTTIMAIGQSVQAQLFADAKRREQLVEHPLVVHLAGYFAQRIECST